MLNDTDKEILREHIQDELVMVGETLTHLREAAKPVAPDNALGRLTRMEAIGDQNVAKAKLAQLQERREKLQDALKRVSSASYGVCTVCKQSIPMDRLLALPEAKVCMTCLNRARGSA